jgi:glycosyltransferase involved in cell wall biosynthesis
MTHRGRGVHDAASVSNPLVLHVLPVDIARGAQTYARELRDRLDGRGVTHRTLTIFGSDDDTLNADVKLEVADGLLRRLVANPRGVWRLRTRLRAMRPSIVVAHGGEPLKYCVLAGVPHRRLVYYKIGIAARALRGPRRAFQRALCRRAEVVAGVSVDVLEEARRLGVDQERLALIPNGRDAAVYAPAAEPIEKPFVRLAFVGRLTSTKRPERFIELVRALHDAQLPVEGVVAGTGPLLPSITAEAAGLPITMLGAVGDVPAVLRDSDVFVFTSVPAGEGMPGVLIEAGLTALPVVTTRVPGATDVVDDGTTGFVVPVDDDTALFTAARTLVEDARLRARFGSGARVRCEERFGLQQSIDRWEHLLADMLGEACASSM